MELEQNREPATAGKHRPARGSLFRREAISIAEVGVQTFAVMLGILLALPIDDWRRNRDTADTVASAMLAVRGELEANRNELTESQHRLHTLVDALDADAKADADARKPCNEYDNWNGIGVPVLLDAAYQTTIATQVFAHTDFARAQTIAAAYGEQRIFLEERLRVFDLLLRAEPHPISFCRGVVAELAALNDTTIVAYAKAIAAAAN